ncbi:non-hydrolyzing UDP-N-acetylglucosamine 2-epimerase [Polaromonas sp.]|uniref:non-hydrolyzing UDP-N-acetylglucosamine 2-epimerase n=1 Tax=Polaromonas sp. TaxID=1869339 RepID=UPI002731D1B7|nr:UDP-N-acetylglucosamine 2-epimerase (non-hydrolyzing) [Polaromonas sp.]MDP1740662.1 UDP-N-acetylglucosamine 2-epimerase (non-hydrolyzing) [Polaromonas sp.]
MSGLQTHGVGVQEILLVSGTRPEIIKLAPVYHALRGAPWARVSWLHTGQHADMADQILACFDVVPDISLSRGGDSLLDFSTGCRQQLDAVMQQRDWSLVMVQGDTESAFQGALAGFYHRVPVAHVEAGLRTYNLARPFPEEGLRQMISRLARFHFAPTQRALVALQNEGIADELITLTGNTVIDAQQWACVHRGVQRQVAGRGHLLVTVHRRENWGHDVQEICHAIADIARQQPDLNVLFPVHLNPAIQGPVNDILGGIANVTLTSPLDYTGMQQALADAWLVLTDSGGLQEEAPTFGVPVLVLRDETERPEAIEAGCALLIGVSRAAIVGEVARLSGDKQAYLRMSQAVNPFGDGTASSKIVAMLASALANEPATVPEFA